MSKKKSARRKKPKSANAGARPAPSIQEAAESRTAVAATVGWMLALMATLTAELIGLLCRWYTILVEPRELLTIISVVMLFVAFIAGTLTVGLIPVVTRVAQTRPPRAIVKLAIVAGSLPIGVVLVQFLTRS